MDHLTVMSSMIYLDNAATSNNKPKKVKKAVLDALDNSINVGRNSSCKSFFYAKKVYNVREEIRELLNVDDPSDIVFSNNASMALNMGFKGIVNKGDHIITTFAEHNSILRQLYGNDSIKYSFLPMIDKYYVDISQLENMIEKSTKLLVINCASNVTGNIVDYKKAYESSKKHNIPILFDISQAVGNLKFDFKDMKKCIVAFSGHKSLLGPQGTGVLYISEDLNLKTILEGGTGSMSEELKHPDFMPDRFEVGTINTPGILGLGEGVRFVKKEGIENLYSHKIELLMELYHELKNIKNITVYHDGQFFNKIPILSFNINGMYSEETAKRLSKDFDISVRGGYHCAPLIHNAIGTKENGAVRISPGYKTTKNEIKKFVCAINKISKI